MSFHFNEFDLTICWYGVDLFNYVAISNLFTVFGHHLIPNPSVFPSSQAINRIFRIGENLNLTISCYLNSFLNSEQFTSIVGLNAINTSICIVKFFIWEMTSPASNSLILTVSKARSISKYLNYVVLFNFFDLDFWIRFNFIFAGFNDFFNKIVYDFPYKLGVFDWLWIGFNFKTFVDF
jgi:hypothetical protein